MVNQTDLKIKMIKEIIDKNFAESTFRVKQIADEMQISKQYLYELCYMHYNMSPQKMIETFRLEKAVDLLLKEDTIMVELSKRTGYRYLSSFHRAFKKRLDVTPYELRKNMLEAQSDKEKFDQTYRELIEKLAES